MPLPSPVVLIPSYNTGPLLPVTVKAALEQGVAVRVVVDGSTDGSDAPLERLSARPELRVFRLERNAGKGAAVLHGLRQCLEEGFTHVLCMDADGQHPADRIPEFFAWCRRYPEAAVFGRPVFDASAPALRVQGRKISNFWVDLETLGWGIDDSLFGMRLYPGEALLEVFESTRYARRFDFDPEVAVRLAWKGVPIVNLPVPVRYLSAEEGGVSQFRYVRDNALLTWMHARLFFGFLGRVPWLALRGGNPLLPLSPPVA